MLVSVVVEIELYELQSFVTLMRNHLLVEEMKNELLSGCSPGFRKNQVVIRSHPGFNLNLRHTNIRSIFGLHSNWPSKLLFGRIPSFAVPYTIIWSCPRFQCPLSLSGRAPVFTASYTVIWSCARLHDVLYHCLVDSRLHGILYYYLVDFQASQ